MIHSAVRPSGQKIYPPSAVPGQRVPHEKNFVGPDSVCRFIQMCFSRSLNPFWPTFGAFWTRLALYDNPVGGLDGRIRSSSEKNNSIDRGVPAPAIQSGEKWKLAQRSLKHRALPMPLAPPDAVLLRPRVGFPRIR